VGVLRDPPACRDPQLKKPWARGPHQYRHSARGVNLTYFPVTHVYFFVGGGEKSIYPNCMGAWHDFPSPRFATVLYYFSQTILSNVLPSTSSLTTALLSLRIRSICSIQYFFQTLFASCCWHIYLYYQCITGSAFILSSIILLPCLSEFTIALSYLQQLNYATQGLVI